MNPRRACSVDANQGQIADAFRRLGWDVIDTHAVAQYVPGFPDLIVTRPVGLCDVVVFGIEVKMPGGTLTEKEGEFAALHPHWAPIVVYTVDDVLRLTGVEDTDG